MKNSDFSRRDFLKASTVAGLGASLAGISGGCASVEKSDSVRSSGMSSNLNQTHPRPGGQKPVNELNTKPMERIRVAVIGLHRGMTHVKCCLNIEFADVVA